MTTEIKDNKIIITLPIEPSISASGKSLVVASTKGNKTTNVMYEGKPITIGVNAYVSR